MTASSSTSDPEDQPETLPRLIRHIAACRACLEAPIGGPLPHQPRPVVRVSATARLLIAGQAPGARVHASGIPYDDPSGRRLRQWMSVESEIFYDMARIAIVPMGFCFPGYDRKGADRPPRRECRQLWHDRLFAALPQVETILTVGLYAQAYHFQRLGLETARGLTENVARWREFGRTNPRIIPLPHPSWRNNGWLRRNPWFEAELVPVLRLEVARLTGAHSAIVQP
jgi:uracil-DNA glycosylase